jgi:hypothetical protein
MTAYGAQPSPPNTLAAVSYMIPLRTFPAGDWASPCPDPVTAAKSSPEGGEYALDRS